MIQEGTPQNFHEVNAELDRISRDIAVKSFELGEAREAFQRAKAIYEGSFAAHILERKATKDKMTQTDLNASATVHCSDKQIELIVAESHYRRLVNQVRALRDRLDALKECAYNLRAESRIV